MAFPGIFSSDSGMQGDRIGDFATAIARQVPNGRAALFALTSRMRSEDITDVAKVWFEEKKVTGRGAVTSTGGINSSLTTLTLVDAGQYVPNDILWVETTDEYILVNAVAGNTLTIERGFANTVPAAIANNATLSWVGNAHEEGSDKPIAKNTIGVPKMNYTQIFRNTWNLTGTANAVDHYTGSPLAKSRRECGMFHSEGIEKALLFGKKSIGTRNGKPYRTMDGIRTIISTNLKAQVTDTSYGDLLGWFEQIFSVNVEGQPNERIAFCGNKVITTLQMIAGYISDVSLTVAQGEYGWSIWKWITPYGNVTLLTHPLLAEHPVWTKDLYVLHPGGMVMYYLRRTRTEDTLAGTASRNGQDAEYGVLTTELTMGYTCEATAGLYTGIDTASTTLA